ncbi:MAG: pentapeptide repeat-containing protein [Pleurocapsa minor HA4230-MV1]|nr:pentapeptide repeat-containing protein [Pleurocapsa minor HA4230-MV1]
MSKQQKIRGEELLRRFTAGERDFINLRIWGWNEGLFRGIDLSGINFERSYISIDLSGAIVRNANFSNTIWNCTGWKDIDFTGSNMTGVEFDNSILYRCNFSDTIWTDASLWQVIFQDCKLGSADFDKARLRDVDPFW